MTTSKKSQPSNTTLTAPNSMQKTKSSDAVKDSNSKNEKIGHKSGISFSEKSGLHNE